MRAIDADALIKEICEGCGGEIRESCKTDPVCATCMWLVEAPTIEVPRWIPVTERLPTEDDVNYYDLVLAKHRVAEDAEAWNYRAIARHPSEFTYWMPIPKLPEE